MSGFAANHISGIIGLCIYKNNYTYMGIREFFRLPQENLGDKTKEINNDVKVDNVEEAIALIKTPEKGAMTQTEKSKLLATFFKDDLNNNNFKSLQERYKSWSLDKNMFQQALTWAVVYLEEAKQTEIIYDLNFKKLLKMCQIDERILQAAIGMEKNRRQS